MKNKTLWIAGLCILAVLLAGFLYFKLMLSSNPEIKLTEDKLITNQTFVNMIVHDMKSPLGNNLTKMVLETNVLLGEMNGIDKVAYYVCTQNENEGWISYSPRGIVKLYGPYGWCYV